MKVAESCKDAVAAWAADKNPNTVAAALSAMKLHHRFKKGKMGKRGKMLKSNAAELFGKMKVRFAPIPMNAKRVAWNNKWNKVYNPLNSARNNGTERHKQASRLSQLKANQRALSIAPPTVPHIVGLMRERVAVMELLARHPTLVALFKDIDNVSITDTGNGNSPWNSSKNANRSRSGRDLKKVSVFSVKRQEWMNVAITGGDADRSGVQAHVTRWSKGGWGAIGIAAKTKTLFDKRMTEEAAQKMFVEFIGSSTMLEYGQLSSTGSVDAMRINSWLKIYETKHSMTFYNLGDVCFTNSPRTAKKNSVLFGPGGAVLTTGNAKLAIICMDLFAISNASPTPTPTPSSTPLLTLAPESEDVCEPYLTEVRTTVHSQEELDVQILTNLFFVLRHVYKYNPQKKATIKKKAAPKKKAATKKKAAPKKKAATKKK